MTLLSIDKLTSCDCTNAQMHLRLSYLHRVPTDGHLRKEQVGADHETMPMHATLGTIPNCTVHAQVRGFTWPELSLHTLYSVDSATTAWTACENGLKTNFEVNAIFGSASQVDGVPSQRSLIHRCICPFGPSCSQMGSTKPHLVL